MKKILIIGPFPEPVNGCSLANDVLYNNIKGRGINVDKINTATNIISTSQGTEFSIKKVLSFLYCYKDLYKVFLASVVYTTPGQTLFGILKYVPFYLLSYLLKTPYIIHVHGNYLGTEFLRLSGLKKRVFKFFVSKASAGIVLSESLKKNFDSLLSDKNVYVVKNFVQNEFFLTNYSKQTDKLRILYLSNVMPEKGIFELLAATKQLLEKGIDLELVIAGKIEKEIELEFHTQVSMLGEKVVYKGSVYGEQKLEVLKNANVFVLPTYYTMEGQPISILEGLATGNVIVSTYHGGIPDVISEKNGYLVEPRSIVQLTDALNDLSHKLGCLNELYVSYNINYAKAQFTEAQFGTNILNVIYELSTVK